MVPSLTPYDLPSPPKTGFHMPQDTRMAISLQRVIRSTSRLVLGWGFRKRRIEWRYLRFEHIQDGGHRHVGKISSGDISASGHQIHFILCSRVGFSGTADLMALFPVRTNPRWWPPPSLEKCQMAISPQRLTIYIYNAHRAVIFAIAQLSCCSSDCKQGHSKSLLMTIFDSPATRWYIVHDVGLIDISTAQMTFNSTSFKVIRNHVVREHRAYMFLLTLNVKYSSISLAQ